MCRFGGEAVSLGINYTHKEEFAASGYTPFLVDDTEYGEVRQYGNFSFLRVYEVSSSPSKFSRMISLTIAQSLVTRFLTTNQKQVSSYSNVYSSTWTSQTERSQSQETFRHPVMHMPRKQSSFLSLLLDFAVLGDSEECFILPTPTLCREHNTNKS